MAAGFGLYDGIFLAGFVGLVGMSSKIEAGPTLLRFLRFLLPKLNIDMVRCLPCCSELSDIIADLKC